MTDEAAHVSQRRMEVAEWYERAWVPAMLQEWAERLARLAGVVHGDRVLDVGCGTGVVARACAELVGNRGRVVGLDLSEEMLAVARGVAPHLGWLRGNAGELPFADGSFDRVMSQLALMFFPDRAKAVAEMWRVLRPGGRLAIALAGPLSDVPAYVALIDLVGRHLGEAAASSVASRFVLGDPADLGRIVRSAGVEGFAIETYWGPERFPSPAGFAEAEIRASDALIDLFDRSSLMTLLSEAEQLSPFPVIEGGGVEFLSSGHVVTATRA